MRDLVVVGGGPAGLATALLAARAGMSVTLLERRRFPVDKACGEGIMPGGLARLARLGVVPTGVRFAGVAYSDATGRHRAEARFPHGTGLGVRRTALHAALATAAAGAGVEVVTAQVDEVRQSDREVRAAGVRARWLVAADGLHSPVRRQLGLEPRRRGRPRRFGLRRHWRCRPWSDLVEVVWGPRGEAYVTPVAEDLVGVAVLHHGGSGGYQELLADFPVLARRLRGALPAGPVAGAGPMRQVVPDRVAGRVLLVGDAAGYEDALTGEGISLALAQAESAVAALLAGDPERYRRAWPRITRRYRWLTRGLVTATASAGVRRLLPAVSQRLPGVFGRVVAGLAE